MAANTTIIQAVGQRYAPQKFDYSGYIKGLASVASFLVEKKKIATSRVDNISKISDDAIGNITDNNLGVNVEAAVQEQRDLAYQATKNMGGFHWTDKNKTAKTEYQTALTNIENIVKDNTNWNNLQGEIIKSIGSKTISSYGGAKQKNWLYNIVNNETGIEFVKIEDGVTKIMNPEGEYVSLEELDTDFILKNSSDKLYKKINKNRDEYDEIISEHETSMKDYDALLKVDAAGAAATRAEGDKIKERAEKFKTQSLLDIENMIQDEDAFRSDVFDNTYVLADGTTARFVDYYLSEGGMMDKEQQDQFNKNLEELKNEFLAQGKELSNEDIAEFKNLLVSDIISNGSDGNIKDDYMQFQRALYEDNSAVNTSSGNLVADKWLLGYDFGKGYTYSKDELIGGEYTWNKDVQDYRKKRKEEEILGEFGKKEEEILSKKRGKDWAKVVVGGKEVWVPFKDRFKYSALSGQKNSDPNVAGFAYAQWVKEQNK